MNQSIWMINKNILGLLIIICYGKIRGTVRIKGLITRSHPVIYHNMFESVKC